MKWLFLFSALLSFHCEASVNMKNASFVDEWNDFKSILKRKYNSRSLHSGLLGFGWCTPWETFITTASTTEIHIEGCEGPKKILNLKHIKNNVLNFKNVSNSSSVLFDGKTYIYQNVNGTTHYNNYGRPTYIKRKNLPPVTLKYDHRHNLVEIKNLKFGAFRFKYENSNIRNVLLNNKEIVNYGYSDNGLLIRAKIQGLVYKYRYDDVNNLIMIQYPDQTTKKIQYTKELDQVAKVKKRNGCLEVFSFNKSDDLSFTSKAIKYCNNKMVNSVLYRFRYRSIMGNRHLASSDLDDGYNSLSINYDERGRSESARLNKQNLSFSYSVASPYPSRICDNEKCISIKYDASNRVEKISYSGKNLKQAKAMLKAYATYLEHVGKSSSF